MVVNAAQRPVLMIAAEQGLIDFGRVDFILQPCRVAGGKLDARQEIDGGRVFHFLELDKAQAANQADVPHSRNLSLSITYPATPPHPASTPPKLSYPHLHTHT